MAKRARWFILGTTMVGAVIMFACHERSAPATLQPGMAAVRIEVQALTANVNKVTARVDPAGLSADLTSSGQGYSGTFNNVPVGQQTVTVSAFSGGLDGGFVKVGEGSEPVSVTSGAMAYVNVKILDLTGAVAAPGHGPVITGMSTSNLYPVSGQAISLTVTAIDPDGDALSYLWSSNCGGGIDGGVVPGSFSAPTSASTSWSFSGTGTCVLTATATSGGLSTSRDVIIDVGASSGQDGGIDGGGGVYVDSVYYPNPEITRVTVQQDSQAAVDGGTPVDGGQALDGGLAMTTTYFDRSSDATYREPVHGGNTLLLSVQAQSMSFPDGGTVYDPIALTDSCRVTSLDGGDTTLHGGITTYPPLFPYETGFSWTAPPAYEGFCLITATATRLTMTDSFAIAVYVTP